jgi:predicted MPP superfamily phosphohydrolase
MEPFSRISAPEGVYFITGNHEEFSDPRRYLDAVRQAGIKVLNNEMANLKGLQIIGVDYRDSANRQKYEMILNGIKLNPNLPTILLKHSPKNLDIADKKGIALQLSGHTHKGQLFPINYITALVYHGYDYGFKKFGNLQIYTSSGVGTWGPPMRVGNIPEIVVIRF